MFSSEGVPILGTNKETPVPSMKIFIQGRAMAAPAAWVLAIDKAALDAIAEAVYARFAADQSRTGTLLEHINDVVNSFAKHYDIGTQYTDGAHESTNTDSSC